MDYSPPGSPGEWGHPPYPCGGHSPVGKHLCASVSQQDDAPCLLLSPLLQMALSYCCSKRRWPRTGPGWRGSDNAKCRGWVTASCLTFPHCPGLRRAEQIFFLVSLLALKSSSWHPMHLWMQEVEPKSYQYIQLNCREEPGVEAREQMCGQSH